MGIKKISHICVVILFTMLPLSSVQASTGFLNSIWCSVTEIFGNGCENTQSVSGSVVQKPVEEIGQTSDSYPMINSNGVQNIPVSTYVPPATYITNQYITNEYVTKPIIREIVYATSTIINPFQPNKNYFDTSNFVTLDLFYAQVDKLFDADFDSNSNSVSVDVTAVDDLSAELAQTFETEDLTVSATADILDLNVFGSVQFLGLGGGVLVTDSSGNVSTTTIGGVISPDSLNFSDLSDSLIVDANTSFDLDTNSVNLNFDNSTFYVAGNTNKVGIGTSSPYARLSIQGGTGQTHALAVASSTGANLLNVDKRGVLTLGSGGTASLFINGGGSTLSPANVTRSIAIGNDSLRYFNTNAIDNIAIGYKAFEGQSGTPMTGVNNIAIGNLAGQNNTSGVNNIFLGYSAGNLNTTGYYNTFLGAESGYSNDDGSDNTFVGSGSGSMNTSGSYNAFFGSWSGAFNNGSGNSFFGYGVGLSNDVGSYNSFYGSNSGETNYSGSDNAFYGNSSGNQNYSGSRNAYIGNYSGHYNQTGGGNVAFGYGAGEGSSGQSYASSTMIGYQTGLALTTGSKNILLGYQAGDALTSGSNNIVIGYDIDAPSNTGSNQLNIGNTLFGINVNSTGTTVDTDARLGIGTSSPYARLSIQGGAGQNFALAIASSTGANLLSVDKRGVLTLGSNTFSSIFINGGGDASQVTRSIAIGGNALGNVSPTVSHSSEDNVAIGYSALNGNGSSVTGSYNVSMGNYSGEFNTTGSNNAFFGDHAGNLNNTGNFNTFIGNEAGLYNEYNSFNTFIGAGAGYSGGEAGVALGYQAGAGYSASSTIIGYAAGANLSGGNRNILLGYQAGDALTSGSNNIVIGYDIDAPNDADNQLNIGNVIFGTGVDSTGTTVDANAKIGIGTSSPLRRFDVYGSVGFTNLTSNSGAGSLCLTTSKEVVFNNGSDSCLPSVRALKHDINNISYESTTEKMMEALKPVNFIYNYDDTNRIRYGFIADEVVLVDQHLVTYNQDGELSGLDTNGFLALIISSIQDIYKKITGFSELFVTKKVETESLQTDKLCIEDICLTADELRTLINNSEENVIDLTTPEAIYSEVNFNENSTSSDSIIEIQDEIYENVLLDDLDTVEEVGVEVMSQVTETIE